MKILGIDIGSTATKLAVMKNNGIIQSSIMSTMKFYKDYCVKDHRGIAISLEALEIGDVDKIISTGYGRNNIKLSNTEAINELKAHCYGAIYSTGLSTFTLLDIGGQDTKVLRVEKGIIIDLDLNDKCAASSGRFIENMARVMEVGFDWLTRQHHNPTPLNTTCAVFGESELIGKIAEGVDIKELAAGVNYSLYKRVEPILKKFHKDILVFTGGVSNNQAILYYLKALNYQNIIVPGHAQLNGAIGCCYYGNRFN